jgi:hypothetical protein
VIVRLLKRINMIEVVLEMFELEVGRGNDIQKKVTALWTIIR